jgi:hypothetical protein
MSLSDIKKKLYSKNADENLTYHAGSEFDARQEAVGADSAPQEVIEDKWVEGVDDMARIKRRNIRFGIGAIGVVILLGVGLIFSQSLFKENKVIVNVEGVSSVASGSDFTAEISYVNDNDIALKDAVLRVNYPEIFKPGENINFKAESQTSGVFSIGEIARKSTGKVILRGSIFSPKGTLMYVKSDLVYTHVGTSGQFASKGQLAVNVEASVIDLEISSPQELSNGDALDYEINYVNKSQAEFDNIKIKIEYPEGFVFSKAVPEVSEGTNVWSIGHVSPNQSGKIIISGKMIGSAEQVKNAIISVGALDQNQFIVYNTEKTSTKMVSSPLVITQSVNGSNAAIIGAGGALRFIVAYKNEGDTGLRDVIVTDKIDSPLLDYKTLRLKGGVFDDETKTITWKASDDKKLKFFEPGQEGLLSFEINVLENIPGNNANDKNLIISNFVKIDSPDVPRLLSSNKIISGSVLDIKLESKVIFQENLAYKDETIPNSGPVAPQAGEASTYTVHWKVSNVSNDITGVKIESVLPTYVEMTGKISPDDGRLTYNARNNSIAWDLGQVPAWTGILNSPKEVAFQISIKPSQIQEGKEIILLNPAYFTAKDSFTGRDLKSEISQKNTYNVEN